MRLPKERPTERKVTESWGFSGKGKKRRIQERKERRTGPRRRQRTLSWKPEANT